MNRGYTPTSLFFLFFGLLLSINIYAQDKLPYYKSEKILVNTIWSTELSGDDSPRVIKSPKFGDIELVETEGSYTFSYDNLGVAEYDTAVIFTNGQLQSYAFKSQFVTAGNDTYIAYAGQSLILPVLLNDQSYSDEIEIENIPFHEGVRASIENNNIRVNGLNEGLQYLYYTVCDDFGNCDEGKVSIYVLDPSANADTLIFSSVEEKLLSLPIPGDDYEIQQTTIDSSFIQGEEMVLYLDQSEPGFQEVVLSNQSGSSVVYQFLLQNYWVNNNFNNSDYVFIHPDKEVIVDIGENDLWNNIYAIGEVNTGISVSRYGSGRVKIIPERSFRGISFFQYITCSNVRCDTARVKVYVNDFRPAKDEFTLYIDKDEETIIPFYSPNRDFEFEIVENGDFGTASTSENGKEIVYTPDGGFQGEDRIKIRYSYENSYGEIFESYHFINFEESSTAYSNTCTDCVWPGDTDLNGVVNLSDIENIAKYIGEKGAQRNGGLIWKPQYNQSWNNFEDKKLNHFDANGDGIISELDIQAIPYNYGKVHGLFSNPVTQLETPIWVETKSVSTGRNEIVLEIYAGDEEHPLEDVNGMSLDVEYEDNISGEDIKVASDHSTWLKSHQPTMELETPGEGNKVHVGQYRVRTLGKTGFGLVLKLRIIVEDEIEGFTTIRSKDRGTVVNLNNIKIHSGQGDYYLPNQTVILSEEEDADSAIAGEIPSMKIYPNPAVNFIMIDPSSGIGEVDRINIYSIEGQLVKTQENNLNNSKGIIDLPVDDIPQGIYVVEICAGGEKIRNRCTLIR